MKIKYFGEEATKVRVFGTKVEVKPNEIIDVREEEGKQLLALYKGVFEEQRDLDIESKEIEELKAKIEKLEAENAKLKEEKKQKGKKDEEKAEKEESETTQPKTEEELEAEALKQATNQ